MAYQSSLPSETIEQILVRLASGGGVISSGIIDWDINESLTKHIAPNSSWELAGVAIHSSGVLQQTLFAVKVSGKWYVLPKRVLFAYDTQLYQIEISNEATDGFDAEIKTISF